MKAISILLAGLVISLGISASKAQVVFQQDFGAGGVPADYVNATYNGADFQSITNGASASWNITGNTLQMDRTASTATAKSIGMPTSPANVVAYQFDFNLINALTTGFSFQFQVGSGFSTANTNEFGTGNLAARFAITFTDTVTNTYRFRDLEAGVTAPTDFTGTSSVFYVVNTSAVAYSFTDPTAATSTINPGSFSLWVNANPLFTNQAVFDPSLALTDFSLMTTGTAGQGVFQFDNISATVIPEPSQVISLVMLGLIASAALVRNYRKKTALVKS